MAVENVQHHIATKLGIESKMFHGRRITDLETLEVITMVYGGLVNKNIVAKLQAFKYQCDWIKRCRHQ